MLRGLGVTMALPWLESLPVWGDEPRGSEAPAKRSGAAGRALLGQRLSQQGVVGQGEGSEMELGKVLAPLDRLPREDALHPRPVQRRSAEGEHPQLADRQPAFRRAAGLRRRDPVGHEHRSAARAALRPLDQSAEPRSRLREVEPVGAQELLDALQLAHFVELADDAHAAGALSRAGLRPPVQRRSPAGRQERARRRARRRHRSAPADQQHRSAQARRISRLGSRRRAADRATPARRASCRAGGRRSPSRTSRARRRHPAGHRRAHAADVRHPRARLPDRHHAHLHAQAEQRSLARCGSRTSASTT